MSKHFFAFAFAVGLGCLAWVGAGFAGSNWPALAMTVLIAAVYLLGAVELSRFRGASMALSRSLQQLSGPPATLADWLAGLPASMRNAVRLRIEDGRGGLPAPALTPYLVGLLVMLGMLGTFLGMIVTFKGAVFALEGSTDLQAIRSALAEPIRGLGLSFGTSVAGVAASAMLGLMSAISRRERLEVAGELDQRIATVLSPFSLVHQRRESFRAIELQAHALPQVAERLESLMERIERRSEQLDLQLLQRQERFQQEVAQAYADLARGVGASLQDSLAAGARTAGEAIRPVVEGVADAWKEALREHARTNEAAAAGLQQALASFAGTFEQRSTALLATIDGNAARSQAAHAQSEQQRLAAWTEALQALASELQGEWRRAGEETIARQQAACDALDRSARHVTERASEQAVRTLEGAARLLDDSRELVHARTETEARWIAQHGERMDQLAALWRTELAALRQEESARGEAAVRRLHDLQDAVAQNLATLGAALEAPIGRLLHTAAEVPEAAARVITQLREEMGRVAERDNLALEERAVLLERLDSLLQAVHQATGEQRAAIETMVASAATVLENASGQFAQALEAQAGKASDMAAHVSGSAVELASLAEAFEHGVQLFQASSDKLVGGLQQVEASLNRATTRSDEQLAYYVAQAREVIDLSIASQQGLVENLRQLQARPGKTLALVEGARA